MTDLPFLLRGQDTSYVLSGESLDFRSRMGAVFGERLSDEAAPVLILTRADDREADAVGLSLAARGVPYLRLDADRLPAVTAAVALHGDLGTTERSISLQGRERLAPCVVWFRRFDPAAIPTPRKDDPMVCAFSQGEWYLAVRGLLAGTAARWVNHPAAVRALDSITQLRLAGSVGLAIPETLVSNDPERIRAFVGSHPGGVIAKTLGHHFVETPPGTLRGVFPRLLTEEDTTELQDAALVPSMFQEYVSHVAEVRATVIGRRIVAVRIVKVEPEDVWRRPSEVLVEEHSLPERIRNVLLEYAEAARLEYGAFDLLVGEDGRYVFLEVNPEGDWMWLEDRNERINVTEKVSSHIAGLIEGGA